MSDNKVPVRPDAASEFKRQAKSVGDKIMLWATKKYRINFEVYGWVIAAIVLILLILIMQ
jgi:hypothetical protein